MDEITRVDVFDTGDLQAWSVSTSAKTAIDELTNWSANRSTVFRENLWLQKLKRSLRDGPSRSRTIAL